MLKPLRVLIVEDSDNDAKLLLLELRRSGWQPTSLRIETEQAMRQALDSHQWDIVIADYSLPQFSGIAALALLRQQKPDLPFILVSGVVGEEMAVQALKAGANDYLFKGNLKRLGPAVERELREAQEKHKARHTEKELRKTKSELAATEGLAAANKALQKEIAERHIAQRALQELNETLEQRVAERTAAAEASSRAKSEFLANMSHEIRTPMTAIVGFSEMLLRPNQEPAERAECIHTIQRNAVHLLDLISGILDLSKIEAGKMTVEKVSCDLPQLMADTLSIVRPRAMEKSLKLGIKFAGPIPRKIETDPLKIRQILVNLLGNAIKFTSKGGVGMRVRFEPKGTSGVLRIHVVDNGVGMTPEQCRRIFERFAQADESTTRRFGGTGLGLTISRRFAQLLGGDIQVTSEPGRGSTFTMTVKCGIDADAEMLASLRESDLPTMINAAPTSDILLRGRILLVEDGRDNQRLLSSHLETAGANVSIAENGRVAIDMATSQPFDLILMDMQMPEMDGYTATKELRRRSFAVPIVALTANAMAEDRAKCMASGCTDYLSKPIGWNTLMKTVSRYLGHALPSATPPPDTHVPDAPEQHESPPKSGTISSTAATSPRMKKIISEFVEELPAEVSKMQNLLNSNDLGALKSVVHQLRGAGGGYGFDSISQLAAKAEESIKAADNLEAIVEEINSLIDLIRHIEGFDESRAMTSPDGETA
jgi:signal transduction histidine kinase/HPt (histidine-containing phosphotransfer) domain-containing protein